ncbi:DUF4231 domain-containing protein [Streptomyces chartreusis]
MTLEQGLLDPDLPGIQQSADKSSLKGQAFYLRLTKARLWSVIAAAVCGMAASVSDIPESLADGLLATSLLAFIIALGVEIRLLSVKPEEAWYQGRAIAESIKTLAWKYSMGADPFPITISEERASSDLNTKIREIIEEAPDGAGGHPNSLPQISPKMRQLRRADLQTRIKAYTAGRIHDQHTWYAAKAIENENKSSRWRFTLLALEILGAAGSLLMITDILDLDVGGVLAAAIAGGGAWIEVKQFDNLASAYSLTSTELALVKAEGESVETEEAFSNYVTSAEQAISREHTMWLARRNRIRLHGGRS